MRGGSFVFFLLIKNMDDCAFSQEENRIPFVKYIYSRVNISIKSFYFFRLSGVYRIANSSISDSRSLVV